MEKHIITKMGIFNIQVCSEGTHDEALDWVQKESPAGTTGNWQKTMQENLAPVPCKDHPNRTHYIFDC